MEATRSRSQSPFTKNKTKGQSSDCGENGDDCADQIKTRKRNQKNKQKSQIIEKENKDLENNENGIAKKNVMESSNQLENIISNAEQCNEITNRNGGASGSSTSCPEEEESMENNNFNNDHDDKVQFDTILEPLNEIEPHSFVEFNKNEELKENDQENHNGSTSSEFQSKMENVDLEIETEPEKMIESEFEDLEGKINSNKNLPEVNNISVTCTYGDETTNGSSLQDLDVEVNGSHENSIYEDANISEENFGQTSPDTAAKQDTSFSDKLSSFLGKWNSSSPSQNQKQDSEVSYSKKCSTSITSDAKVFLHPYLSKVSGRPGIKERLNSDHTTNGKDVETPKNLNFTLDDSFRVKSDPPRLNQKEVQENSILRKYKGKRCLNTCDESEDGEDVSNMNSKRRKLDDNLSKPGILGSILLSPFKKRPLNVDESSKLTTSQSKLSRFLSPFWFWKKTSTPEQD